MRPKLGLKLGALALVGLVLLGVSLSNGIFLWTSEVAEVEHVPEPQDEATASFFPISFDHPGGSPPVKATLALDCSHAADDYYRLVVQLVHPEDVRVQDARVRFEGSSYWEPLMQPLGTSAEIPVEFRSAMNGGSEAFVDFGHVQRGGYDGTLDLEFFAGDFTSPPPEELEATVEYHVYDESIPRLRRWEVRATWSIPLAAYVEQLSEAH